ncbi:MAG TPA: ATP synthase subunit I [Bryobacteraceae bacterium]|nr:ATP synthase subunit I [Bryobacteraceae bacterium]
MAPDPLSFDSAAARIGRILVIVSLLGTFGALTVGGWKSGAGFLLGAAISGLNYHWLHKLVKSLGGGSPPRYRSIVLGFRYLILGGGAYVIVRLSPISVKAVLAGLFVLTAALFVEVACEIVYARK